MVYVNNIRLPLGEHEQSAVEQAYKKAGLLKSEVATASIAKVAVDARHRQIMLVYSVALECGDENREAALQGKHSDVAVKKRFEYILKTGSTPMVGRPLVCGFGPAGIFAALQLARHGFKPIVIEQGQPIEARTAQVAHFNSTGQLNAQSNIQFGEGGAGAFSDGKLTTRIGDARTEFVLNTFIQHGASADILVKNKPHIGTDELVKIIVSMRKEIESLGGTVLFDTELTDILVENGRVRAVQTAGGEIACGALILATGHSARNMFNILKKRGQPLVTKPFSVGFRIEHPQADIDRALYKDAAGHPALPQGEYALSTVAGGRGVYTFCMCPGGFVVAAASEQGGVTTNGMSYNARAGKNANSAVVAGVDGQDFADVFAAVQFQQALERAAFAAGGGNFAAPAQTVRGFLGQKPLLSDSYVKPTYARGVTPYDIGSLLPQNLAASLREGLAAFDKKLSGFANPGAVLTGLETRTSCPARALRGENYESSGIEGLYPCGEGAGYAGGIVSAAVDGLRVSGAIIERYSADYSFS